MTGRLDSRSLELFLAVADTLSFRQAAQTLHLSQPPLSRAIRALEERLGTRLFDRNTQAVSLTDGGRRLVPFARGVARLLRQAEAELALRALPTTLRLGLTSAVEPTWFSELALRVQAAQPALHVALQSDSSPRLVHALRKGRLDAAFIALPTDAAGLEVVELDRLPMVVALPSTHPLARRRVLRLSDLAAEPLFWFERARQPAFFDHCHRVFARHGFAPRRLGEAHDHHVLLADVAAGRGIALLPRSFAALRRAGVGYRALREGDELSVGVGLVTAADRPAVRALLSAVAGPKPSTAA